MMEKIKSNKIKLIIIVAAIILLGAYLYYDFYRQQAADKEIEKLKQEIIAISKSSGCSTGTGVFIGGDLSETNLEKLLGKVKSIEDNVIILSGSVFPPGENKLNISSQSDWKDYKVGVLPQTTIESVVTDKNGKEIKLTDIKAGNILFVLGQINPFHKDEMTAYEISVRR